MVVHEQCGSLVAVEASQCVRNSESEWLFLEDNGNLGGWISSVILNSLR